ncbi:MAG TPA: hypothetical protein VFR47_02945 [Anaerolineales bacterium]|nr:hypothetical protein [Anaerolineales bacterium]
MIQSTSSPQPSAWKVWAVLGALLLICCLGVLCYWMALFVVVDRNISLVPTATLNPTCETANCLNACIRRLPDFEIAPLGNRWSELSKKEGGYELARYRLDEQTSELKQVAQPTVPEYLGPYQTDTQLHQRIWNYFTGIFPNDTELHVSYMAVYMDSSEDRYQASIWNLDGKWRLYINLVEFNDPESVVDTLAHEYGHMLTLNGNQVTALPDEYGLEREQTDFDKMRAKCNGQFFSGYECAIEKSYLNEFGNRFWVGDVYDTWVQVFLLSEKDQSAIDEFYTKYSDQFVTDYAATNPHEDIAESWTEFIMRPKPTGTSIADQKILFFYEFPELVQLRSEVIYNVCQYAITQK